VADGENQRLQLAIDDDIRYIWLSGKSTIGHKRNVGCKEARGEIVVHWDDDDYSAPGRIADQVERIKETGKPVTGYQSMRFTDGRQWWLYAHRAPTYCLGTSLCYRKDWWAAFPFKDSQHVEEDRLFILPAVKRRDLALAPAGDMMYATIHGGNTSPRETKGPNWTKL
jgi:glycosyltransferase involved in cell wall biosynthesis